MKKILFFITLFLLLGWGCKKSYNPKDTNKPFIIMLGDNPTYSELGKPYDDAGADAFDITATGDTINISSRLKTTNNININKVGKYAVRYNVSDTAGNAADEKTRAVFVQTF